MAKMDEVVGDTPPEKRKRSIMWIVLSVLVGIHIPLVLYDPGQGSLQPYGLCGAAVSAACLVGLLFHKRWAIWLTGARALLGIVISFDQFETSIRIAGGWEYLPSFVQIWIIIGFVYTGLVAVASVISIIQTEGEDQWLSDGESDKKALKELQERMAKSGKTQGQDKP